MLTQATQKFRGIKRMDTKGTFPPLSPVLIITTYKLEVEVNM